jgi:outer membrane protein TolC
MHRPSLLPHTLILLLVLSPAASAQEQPAPYVAPEYIRKPPTVMPEQLAGRKTRQMTLADAIETSLRRNLALALERERVREIDTGRGLALSLFEPFVEAVGNRTDSKAPPTTRQEQEGGRGVDVTRDLWSASVFQRLPTGTQLRLSFASSREESSLGTALGAEVFRSQLGLGLAQPLLRDFSFSTRIQRAPILRAGFASEAAREEARLRALLTVKATEDAYWTLVESWKGYEVTVGTHKLAVDQLELTRRQIAAGTLAESDVILVEGTLAQRQVAVLRAEAQIERAADQLRALLNLPAEEWEQPIVPMDVPAFMHVEVPFPQAFASAQSYRPELGRVRIDLRRIALDLDVAKNARLPRLDLEAEIALVGQNERYGRALDQAVDGNNRLWTVGLRFGWAPLGVGARAEIRRLESILQGNSIDRDQILVGIRMQIREALRAIDTAERELFASARFRDLAERSLDVEQRRFLNGMGNNFFIAQRQAELAQARLAELSALIRHEKASSDLQLATGQLLEARQLRFDVNGG